MADRVHARMYFTPRRFRCSSEAQHRLPVVATRAGRVQDLRRRRYIVVRLSMVWSVWAWQVTKKKLKTKKKEKKGRSGDICRCNMPSSCPSSRFFFFLLLSFPFCDSLHVHTSGRISRSRFPLWIPSERPGPHRRRVRRYDSAKRRFERVWECSQKSGEREWAR